jgi:amino acid transporter
MDTKEIKEQLKNSLDMVSVRMYLFVAGMVGLISGIFALFCVPKPPFGPSPWLVFGLMAAIGVVPLLIFCLWRTISIFRCPGSYHFCKAKLSNPKGGRIRDTIRFLVVLEDMDGNKFTAYTHSIFHTHKSSAGLALEDYVNQEVTVGYNEETGQVVVIG